MSPNTRPLSPRSIHRRPGGEGRVRGADVHTPPMPTSPTQRGATGPSLSPLKGGEGFLQGSQYRLKSAAAASRQL